MTASGGDDVLLECRDSDDALIVSWRKDDTVIEATDTYRWDHDLSWKFETNYSITTSRQKRKENIHYFHPAHIH